MLASFVCRIPFLSESESDYFAHTHCEASLLFQRESLL